MKRKKVAVVGTAGLPASYGGFETLTQNLVMNLKDNYEFIVYCKKTPQEKRMKSIFGARLTYLPFHSNGWQSPIYDIASLVHAACVADIILYLGPVVGYLLPLLQPWRKNIIVNFGGLNEWEREKLSAAEKRYMFVSCLLAARFATNNVADNLVLQKSIKQNFKENSVVIRYGGDHATIPPNNPELESAYPFLREPYYVSVARAQVDNNLHVLIETFKELPDKRLVVVSNWSVSEYGRILFRNNQNLHNIVLLPAIYDPLHLNYVRSRSTAYIHTHSNCGTAPSLVEAICLGLPIISWDVPTNREATFNRALYFDSKESLQHLIAGVSPAQLEAVRDALRPLVSEEYNWSRICRQYMALFDCTAQAAV
jgi:glycosyltransferase involved in cell wall biosynthesis